MIMLKVYYTRRRFICVLLFSIMTTYIVLNLTELPNGDIKSIMSSTNTKNYIIFNYKCTLPNVNPFNEEVVQFYTKETYINCSKNGLLTYVTKNADNTEAMLHINESLLTYYSDGEIVCCYANITRYERKNGIAPDNNITSTKCINFYKNIRFTWKPSILVSCRNYISGNEVYRNVHASVTITEQVAEKIKKTLRRPLSLLYICVDSLSRLNSMRTLPKTRKYLNNAGWLEFIAYNKMGSNTFPNLMSILTGKNLTAAKSDCNQDIEGKIDECNFIWKDFARHGYVTGYSEDNTKISSFNFKKPGFLNEPVDYYFRPYMISADTKLKQFFADGIVYCSGPEMSTNRILNAIKDFTKTFINMPSFGLFWLNGFHEYLNAPTRMDAIYKEFFEDLDAEGIYNNSLIVFISDHGLRFGPILKTHTGWIEERLPMFHMRIPEWFRKENPQEYANLLENQNKLTSPYDLHMTLQDILVYSGTKHTPKPSEGCPNCRSLFTKIDSVRSCEEASINAHWCACRNFEPTNINDTRVIQGAAFILDNIHKQILEFEEGHKCVQYKLNNIVSAHIGPPNTTLLYKSDTHYVIVFETEPSAIFEATIVITEIMLSSQFSFKLEEGISRFDKYKFTSNCVFNANLKPLCHC